MNFLSLFSEYLKPITTAVIASIVYYFFQYYIIVPSGLITVNENIKINERNYTLISIENTEKKPFGPIKIKTDVSISPKNIISNSYVTIDEDIRHLNNSDYKILKIEDIKPLTITRLIIPAKDNNMCCTIIDSGGFDVSNSGSKVRESKVYISIISAVLQGFTLFIFLIIFKIYIKAKQVEFEGILSKRDELQEEARNKILEENSKKVQELEVQREKNLEDKKKIDKELDDLKVKINENSKASTRNRLFLLKRIFDYKKEIKFLRELLSNSGLISKLHNKDFLKLISEKLKTETTHSDVSKEFQLFKENSNIHEDVRDEVELYLSENNKNKQ